MVAVFALHQDADVAVRKLASGHPSHGPKLIIEALQMIPVEQIATIGDMPSDVLMFRKSGVNIAIGNARVEVQRPATFGTTSNENEGGTDSMGRCVP